MGKLPLSVAIITYNEEDIIGKTLEAVKDIADEIIVIDSGSRDKTVEIAENYGAKVFFEEWKTPAEQRNKAFKLAKHEFILFLDADEVLSQELKASITHFVNENVWDCGEINRKTYFLGKFLKHTLQPEWRLRIIRKGKGKFIPRDIGKCTGKSIRLKGDLYHFSYRSLEHVIAKGIKYARYFSEIYYSQRRKTTIIDLAGRPLWSFIKIFFLKKGLFDGYRGLLFAGLTAFYTFMKYAFLLELNMKDIYGDELWKRKER